MFNYSIILFTRIEDLENDDVSLDEYVTTTAKMIPSFHELTQLCKSRYLGISNRWRPDEPKMIEFKVNFFNTIQKLIQSSDNKKEIYSIEQFDSSLINYEAIKQKLEKKYESFDEKEKALKNEIKKLENKIKMDSYFILANEITNMGI